MSQSQEITDLLIDWNSGDKSAIDKLMPLVEGELRRIAARFMRRENDNHTLQTTALVNEAYLKLIDQKQTSWQNRAHFFALSAQLMRRVLLDHARKQHRAKRGGDAIYVDLAEVALVAPAVNEEIIALDEALNKLAAFDEVKSQIVEMRHFGGLTVEEVAEVLKISPVTVMRHWSLAKSWLQRELRGLDNDSVFGSFVAYVNMNPLFWEKIEEIYHSALEVGEEKRADYLEKLCADDTELYSEVESLLAEAEQEDSFLSSSILSAGLAAINEKQEIIKAGRQIGRYKIKLLIERGGMGDVYLAEDTNLRRSVALKSTLCRIYLKSLTAFSVFGRKRTLFPRFLIRMSPRSTNSVKPIKLYYLVMEYIDGKSLRSLMKAKKTNVHTAFGIALQIANALDAAHRKGIIHRDIKPENIMLTRDGFVKVLDFGLAKLSEKQLFGNSDEESFKTAPNLIMGTVKYMSPEQVRGEEVDERTDIWSLGVVLYEMIFGERPFARRSECRNFQRDSQRRTASFERISVAGSSSADDKYSAPLSGKKSRRTFSNCCRFSFALDSHSCKFSTQLLLTIFSVNQDKNKIRRFWRVAIPLVFLGLIFAGVLLTFYQAQVSALNHQPDGFLSSDYISARNVWSARFLPGGNSIVYSATWNGNAWIYLHCFLPNPESREFNFPIRHCFPFPQRAK